MLSIFLKTTTLWAAAAVSLLAIGAPEASAAAVHRAAAVAPHSVSTSRSWTGPEGRTYSRTGRTSCAGGTCDRSVTYTGPNGGTVSGEKSVTRTSPGHFTSSGSVTGPNGNTVSRTGATNCWGDACVHRGTITGPNGGTVNTVGAAWR